MSLLALNRGLGIVVFLSLVSGCGGRAGTDLEPLSEDNLASELQRVAASAKLQSYEFDDFGPTLALLAPPGAEHFRMASGVVIHRQPDFYIQIKLGTHHLREKRSNSSIDEIVVDSKQHFVGRTGKTGFTFGVATTLGVQDFYIGDALENPGSRKQCLLMMHCASSLQLKSPLPSDPLSALSKLKAKVTRNAQAKPVAINLWGTDVSDTTLKLLSGMPRLQRVSLGNTCITDDGLLHLMRLHELKALDLSNTRASEAGLSRLGALKKLERLTLRAGTGDALELHGLARLPTWSLKYLDLTGNPLDDKALAPLSAMEGLQTLILDGSKVTGPGLKHLVGLSLLKSLSLTDTPISDSELSDLSALNRLENLCLSGTPISGDCLARGDEQTALRSLDLQHTQVTADGLSNLTRYPRLTHILLDKSTVNDQALRHLAKLPKLKSLTLNDTRITDAGLNYLANAASLKFLLLTQTTATEAGVAKLRKALPQATIRFTPARNE